MEPLAFVRNLATIYVRPLLKVVMSVMSGHFFLVKLKLDFAWFGII